MKKYIYYIMAVTMIGMGTACSEDFIDKTPDLKVTEASIFESATRLEAAVEGVYTSLKGSDDVSDGYFLGGFATLAGDNRTDDMINYGNNGYTMRDTYSHSVNASSIENDALFRNAYLAINYANTIIDGIEKTYADNLPCDTETARRYVQECKFVRAIAYYYLSQLYGLPYKTDPNASNVPLRIEAVTAPDTMIVPPRPSRKFSTRSSRIRKRSTRYPRTMSRPASHRPRPHKHQRTPFGCGSTCAWKTGTTPSPKATPSAASPSSRQSPRCSTRLMP